MEMKNGGSVGTRHLLFWGLTPISDTREDAAHQTACEEGTDDQEQKAPKFRLALLIDALEVLVGELVFLFLVCHIVLRLSLIDISTTFKSLTSIAYLMLKVK